MLTTISSGRRLWLALGAAIGSVLALSGCSGFSPGTPDPGAAGTAYDRAKGAAGSAFDIWLNWVTTKEGGLITAAVICIMVVGWFFKTLRGNRAVQFIVIGSLVGYAAYSYALSH